MYVCAHWHTHTHTIQHRVGVFCSYSLKIKNVHSMFNYRSTIKINRTFKENHESEHSCMIKMIFMHPKDWTVEFKCSIWKMHIDIIFYFILYNLVIHYLHSHWVFFWPPVRFFKPKQWPEVFFVKTPLIWSEKNKITWLKQIVALLYISQQWHYIRMYTHTHTHTHTHKHTQWRCTKGITEW